MSIPPHQVYSEELARAFRRGYPIADPHPGFEDGEYLRPVGIGDVGYIHPTGGDFIRLFNVHLDPGVDGQPDIDSLPEGFRLPLGQVRRKSNNTPVWVSQSVIRKGVDVEVSGPFFGGSAKFESSNEYGAILATPDPIDCSDALNILSYKLHMKAHVESWHQFARENGHNIELEHLTLVTGVDKTTSWATAVFAGRKLEAGFGLQVQFAEVGVGVQLACHYSWQSTSSALVNSGPVPARSNPSLGITGIDQSGTLSASSNIPASSSGTVANFDTERQPINTARNQSIFIRHMRAKRRRFWPGLKLEARGESDVDEGDNRSYNEDRSGAQVLESDSISIYSFPQHELFFDCLDTALDFILERSTVDIAIAHDEDLDLLPADGTYSLGPYIDGLPLVAEEGYGFFRNGISSPPLPSQSQETSAEVKVNSTMGPDEADGSTLGSFGSVLSLHRSPATTFTTLPSRPSTPSHDFKSLSHLVPVIPHHLSPSDAPIMRTNKRGRPFSQDLLHLFGVLAVSLQFTTHRYFFRTLPNSFATDEAARSLANLEFSQSKHVPDPQNPSQIITTTTTKNFSITGKEAQAVSQHIMDAQLIEDAADPTSSLFKGRGVYVLTPKGLHVLECFIARNGINADHLSHVFATQPICAKLLHLERRSIDDEIIISQSVIIALFRRFVGRSANYPPGNLDSSSWERHYHERSKGIQLQEATERSAGKPPTHHRHCFMALPALEWLCGFTTVAGREEAAEMAAQFVRFGLITLVSDTRKSYDSAIIFTVRGSVPHGNSVVQQTGEFRCTVRAIYKITGEGIRVAQWTSTGLTSESPRASSSNLTKPFVDMSGEADITPHHTSLAGMIDVQRPVRFKESNTERLRLIIDQPQLHQLFYDFLCFKVCEENLSFWDEVENIKHRFNIASNVSTAVTSHQLAQGEGSTFDARHEALIQQAFEIYETYLADNARCELSLEHSLREELFRYLSEVTQSTVAPFPPRLELESLGGLDATQLFRVIKLYERIQIHVFRLMAADPLPKFMRTPQYMDLLRNDDLDFLDSDVRYLSAFESPDPPVHTHEGEEVGGTYFTCSRRAFSSSAHA